MTKPLLTFTKVGGPISLQDLGRRHSMHLGVTEAGAMDIHAMCWANRLLERDVNEPVFEITLGNSQIEFQQDCQIALTGADLNATLNGRAITPWQTYHLKQGDTLEFGFPQTGLRAYLAINAKLDLQNKFNSCALVEREKLADLDSNKTNNGKQIHASDTISSGLHRVVPKKFIPDYQAPLVIDLIPGYQFDQFPPESIDTLLNKPYQIRSNSNRMAYALEGHAIKHNITSLASEGIAYGAVQIPPDGQPVILLNDRQTMGGYPKVGCVSRLYCGALAQRVAPGEVAFRAVEVGFARERLMEFLRFFIQTY